MGSRISDFSIFKFQKLYSLESSTALRVHFSEYRYRYNDVVFLLSSEREGFLQKVLRPSNSWPYRFNESDCVSLTINKAAFIYQRVSYWYGMLHERNTSAAHWSLSSNEIFHFTDFVFNIYLLYRFVLPTCCSFEHRAGLSVWTSWCVFSMVDNSGIEN